MRDGLTCKTRNFLPVHWDSDLRGSIFIVMGLSGWGYQAGLEAANLRRFWGRSLLYLPLVQMHFITVASQLCRNFKQDGDWKDLAVIINVGAGTHLCEKTITKLKHFSSVCSNLQAWDNSVKKPKMSSATDSLCHCIHHMRTKEEKKLS